MIVEDDKLARQGLINVMPWASHDMIIAGEAKNGRDGLLFLDSHTVDLVITDISMPVMSGFDFLSEAKSKYPQLMFVILTLHESFDYAQQAIRLDVLDYISKIQLEEEKYDQVLEHIRQRYAEKKSRSEPAETGGNDAINCASCIVIAGCGDLSSHSHIEELSVLLKENILEIGTNLWIYYIRNEENNDFRKIQEYLGNQSVWYALLKVTDLEGRSRKKFHHDLRKYNHNFLFSKSDSGTIHIRDLESRLFALGNIPPQEFESLHRNWRGLGWVSGRERFTVLLEDLKHRRLSFPVLFKLLVQLEKDWKDTYSFLSGITLPDTFGTWEDVVKWLEDIYNRSNHMLQAQQLSPDVLQSIIKSVQIIHDELDTEVFATNVSQRVSMSRSYFCQCFKKVVGVSFNQYLRSIRVEKAKTYLSETDKPIQWIAGQTGYMDEKYFSKVFKSEVGVLPSVYRQSLKSRP